jgi:hypothetical protein
MIRSLNAAAVFLGALLIGVFLGATSQPRAYADAVPGEVAPVAKSESPPPPPDPKKKMPGDVCKSSDECQKHHSCVKVGDKSVCQAPPRPHMAPGAVT